MEMQRGKGKDSGLRAGEKSRKEKKKNQ